MKNLNKFSRKLFQVMLALTISFSNAQQLKWVLPGYQWDMQTTSLSSAALTGSSSSTFMLSNGAYDANGNLLFSVKDDNIADASGTSIGTLLNYYVLGYQDLDYDNDGSDAWNNFDITGEEVAIVPVPEECKKYYVIYTKGGYIAAPRSYVLYAIVDCSSGSPTVDYPLENNPGVSNAPINRYDYTTHNFGWGLAVSKKYNGVDRYLFMGGLFGIARYTISNTGIASGIIISEYSDEPTLFTTGAGYYSNQELELSPDQQYLAWGNTWTEKLNILKLDSAYTKVPSAAIAEPMADIRGVEFNATSTRIYVSEPVEGVQYYDFSLSAMTPVDFADSLGNTFLELAKNGRIYGVTSSHRLQSIDEVNNKLFLAESSPDVNSDGAHSNGITDRHHLSDQIDGEDYANIAGDATPTADFTINGNAVSTDCWNPTEVFNCSSGTMTLNDLSTNAVSYRILILDQNSSCGYLGSTLHDTGVQSTCPTDLKNLPGGASGNYLAGNTGVFGVFFITENICGVQSYVIKFISVSSAPTGANASFNTNTKTKPGQVLTIGACTVPSNTELTYSDGPTSCGGVGGYVFPMEHSSVAAPNEVGRLSTSFDLSAVSAGIGSSSYQVTVKTDQWDGSTWVSMDSNPAGETITGASSFNLLELVAYDPLSPWYEAFFDFGLTPNGSIYRITITVSNECDDYTSIQIVKLNTTKLKSASVTDENSVEMLVHNLTVYPNPTNDVLTFDYSTESQSEVAITISSIEGKVVKTALSTSVIGRNQIPMDVSEFDAGTYFYTIQLDGKPTTGTIIKQ